MSLKGFIRRLLPTFMVKEELRTGLIFYTVIMKNDGYGGGTPKALEVNGPDEFYEKFLFPENANLDLRLITATRWENVHFPMVDCDNERDFLTAQAFLDSNEIDYSLWESSPGRYWFLVDRWFSNGDKAIKFARAVPGCDQDYCKAANSCGFCAMRLSSKGKFSLSPRMLKKAKNEKLQQFCTALEKFFIDRTKSLQRLDFHRSLFHKALSLAPPGQLLQDRECVRAEKGDLITFNGCLRVIHTDMYNSPCREELGTDLLEGVILGKDFQGCQHYYVVFVDEDPTHFGKESSTTKEKNSKFTILTPFYVPNDHVVQNKGSEVAALLTNNDYHRRRLGNWLSNA